MNKRWAGVLMFAFVVAAIAGLIPYRSLVGGAQPARAAAPTVRIVLATKDREIGAGLREGDILTGDWAGPVPMGSTNKLEDLKGRGVAAPILAKEPIVESRLTSKGAGGGLGALIPKGMRAFAVQVSEIVKLENS
jgi:Flp pilus assembly protein CpaB